MIRTTSTWNFSRLFCCCHDQVTPETDLKVKEAANPVLSNLSPRYFADFTLDKEGFARGAVILQNSIPRPVISASISARKRYSLAGMEPLLETLNKAGVADGKNIANFIQTCKEFFPGREYCRKELTELSHTLDFRSDGKIYVLLKGKVGTSVEAQTYLLKGLGLDKSVTLAVGQEGKAYAYAVINASAIARNYIENGSSRDMFSLMQMTKRHAQEELQGLKKYGGLTQEESDLCTLEEHSAVKTCVKRLGRRDEFMQQAGDLLLTMVSPYASGGDFYGQKFVLLSFWEKVERFCEIANTLTLMHADGVVHRDVKLENSFLYENRAGLGDFAFMCTAEAAAKAAAEGITGTLEYISPEAQCLSVKDPFKSEVYSFGVMLFEGLSGLSWPPLDVPEDKNPQAKAEMFLQSALDYASKLNSEKQKVFQLIGKTLNYDPEGRPTMAVAAEELAVCLKSQIPL